MGARLTFGLMIVAAATLVVGFLTRTSALIYVSIACSLIAVGLLMVSSLRKPAAHGADADTWARSLAENTDTAANPVVVTKGRGRKAKSSDAFLSDVPKASTDADDDEDSEANKAYEELVATTSGRGRTPDVDDTDPGWSRAPRRRGRARAGSRSPVMPGEAGDGVRGDDERDQFDDDDEGVRVLASRSRGSRPRPDRAGATSTTARRPRIDAGVEDEDDTRVLSRTSPRPPRRGAAPDPADDPGSGHPDGWSDRELTSPSPASNLVATEEVPSARPARSATQRVGGLMPGDAAGPNRRSGRRYSNDTARAAGPAGPIDLPDEEPAPRRRGPMDLPEEVPAPRRRGPVDLSEQQRPSRRRGPVDPSEVQRPYSRRGPVDLPDEAPPPRERGPIERPPVERTPPGPGVPPPARPAVRLPAPAAGPSHPEPPRRKPAPPPSEYPFPIEDYDDLRVEEIMPLLPQLYDEELVEVFLHERDGAHRPAILDRLDQLLEGS